MRFLRFRLANYKSFLESPELHFSPGLNVIVGQNNSGKTAMLEAMSLTFVNIPHRSLDTRPTRAAPYPPESSAQVVFEVDTAELTSIMRDHYPTLGIDVDSRQSFETEVARVLPILNANPAIRCSVTGGGNVGSPALDAYSLSGSSVCVVVHVESNAIGLNQRNFVGGVSNRLPAVLASIFRSRVYLFRAERFNVGECAIGTDPTLAPNAANLAQVLHLLHASNPARFRRYESYVKDVFTQIRQITVPPVGGNARILLWMFDPNTERDDLAISLAESGTGIGQVLAMLYVVVTAEHPRTILIDEPHSFLHPSAIRKLLEILTAHRMHQYIITTHSPTALVSSQPNTLVLLRMEGPRTIATEIDPEEAGDLRAVLAEVGARLSDVFGADHILWVEGRTEELCFPLIRERGRREGERATGTVILGVRQTGDFRPRDARATVEIYRRLSTGGALMPPTVGFIFDADGRSPIEQDDLSRETGGLVTFLPRRMFENYLVVRGAISHVVNTIEGFRDTVVGEEEVSAWLARHKWDLKYFDGPIDEALRSDEVWRRTVDGASVLADLFSQLSEQRVVYDKVKFGVRLTQWICDNGFESLAELSDIIRTAVNRSSA